MDPITDDKVRKAEAKAARKAEAKAARKAEARAADARAASKAEAEAAEKAEAEAAEKAKAKVAAKAAKKAETPAKKAKKRTYPKVSVGDDVLAHLNLNGIVTTTVATVAEILPEGRLSLRCNHPRAPRLVREVEHLKEVQIPGEPSLRKVGWEEIIEAETDDDDSE